MVILKARHRNIQKDTKFKNLIVSDSDENCYKSSAVYDMKELYFQMPSSDLYQVRQLSQSVIGNYLEF